MRDPKIDPQAGDIAVKITAKGRKLQRIVTRRAGNEVYYKTSESGAEKNCWLTTWQDWCRLADVS